MNTKPGHSTGTLVFTALASGLAAVMLSRNFCEYEKKIRQLIVTDYGVGDGPFARTVSQLLGPPLVGGNAITILQNGVWQRADACPVSRGSEDGVLPDELLNLIKRSVLFDRINNKAHVL